MATPDALRSQVRKRLAEQRSLVERLLIALLCDGHILIEGVPGLAKTLAASSLAQVIRASWTRIQFTPDDVLANADYCQAGYGVLTDAEREAVKLFAKYEGLLLDPVYTGRAAAGMIDLIRKGFFKKDETVLFWHTGGQPALFADKYQTAILR